MKQTRNSKAEARLQALKEMKAEFNQLISNKAIRENLKALENPIFNSPIKPKVVVA